jgi:hypothetical protein
MKRSRAFSVLATSALLAAGTARADEIENKASIFAGLDKITGRIVKFEAQIGETVQFGTLQITPRSCYTKPQTETPQTVGFVQVDEIAADAKTVDAKTKRIFSGWMFASSPGLNGVEHPVYDVWLLDCKGGYRTLPETADASTPDFPPATSTSASAGATPPAGLPPHQTRAGLSPAITPPVAEPVTAAQPVRRLPPAASKPIQAGAAAPALAPPIEVGEAPVDRPAAIDPPGPLAPALTEQPAQRRRARASAPPEGFSAPNNDDSGFDDQTPAARGRDPSADDGGDLDSPPPRDSDRDPFARPSNAPDPDAPPGSDEGAAPDEGGLRPPALIPN